MAATGEKQMAFDTRGPRRALDRPNTGHLTTPPRSRYLAAKPHGGGCDRTL